MSQRYPGSELPIEDSGPSAVLLQINFLGHPQAEELSLRELVGRARQAGVVANTVTDGVVYIGGEPFSAADIAVVQLYLNRPRNVIIQMGPPLGLDNGALVMTASTTTADIFLNGEVMIGPAMPVTERTVLVGQLSSVQQNLANLQSPPMATPFGDQTVPQWTTHTAQQFHTWHGSADTYPTVPSMAAVEATHAHSTFGPFGTETIGSAMDTFIDHGVPIAHPHTHGSFLSGSGQADTFTPGLPFPMPSPDPNEEQMFCEWVSDDGFRCGQPLVDHSAKGVSTHMREVHRFDENAPKGPNRACHWPPCTADRKVDWTLQNLVKHIRGGPHLGVLQSVCDQCVPPMRLSRGDSLARHVREVHKKESRGLKAAPN